MADGEKNNILHGPPFEYVAQYTSTGKYLFDRLQENPTFIGQIEAHTGHKYTFAEILYRSIRLASWFRNAGIGPGDVVCYVTVTHKDVVIVVYATLFVGAILSPWDPALTTQDIVYFMDLTKPKIVICSKDAADSVKTAAKELGVAPLFVVHGELSGFISFEDTLIHGETENQDFQCGQVEENDVAFLVCTSGTSELPKIMQRTHKSMLITIQMRANRYLPGSVFMSFSPICWVSGLHGLMELGDRIQRVIASYFDEDLAWKWVERYQVTHIFTSTCTFLRMLYCDSISKYATSSLRSVAVGGQTMFAWQYKKFAELAPVGCMLVCIYGVTEMAGVITFNMRTDNPGSSGNLSSGISGKIIDPHTGETISPYELGELCVKSPAMFVGYYNNPTLTASALDSDGWFHTGDLAKFDEKGELFIIDRLKDIIEVNGIQVFPSELEAILLKHPGVDHVGVVGKRVSSNVEHPVAFVERTLGSNVTEAELCDFLNAQAVDDAKELRGGVIFIDKMPRSTSGKIKRWELRKMLELDT